MIKIPAELRGKSVQKIEGLITEELYEKSIRVEGNILWNTNYDDWKHLSNSSSYMYGFNHGFTQLINLASFYRQDFQLEMIQKYFDITVIPGLSFYTSDRHKIDASEYVSGGVLFLTKHKGLPGNYGDFVLGVPFHGIKTLSDFVCACLNTDIKLNWNNSVD